MSAPDLSTVLAPFAAKKYEELFTPEEGYLVYHSKKWEIAPYPPDSPNTTYDELINALAKSPGQYRKVRHLQELVKKINNYYTNYIMSFKEPSLKKKIRKYIFFNSGLEWKCLSNFFPTLIWFPDPITEKETLFPSAENAYQTHKIASLKQDKTLLFQLATLSAPDAKKLANEQTNSNLNDNTAKFKASLMKKILKEKFGQNQTLSRLLLKTNPLELIEQTDSFWGSKKSLPAQEYSNPITTTSKNVLGRLLMEVREEILSSGSESKTED